MSNLQRTKRKILKRLHRVEELIYDVDRDLLSKGHTTGLQVDEYSKLVDSLHYIRNWVESRIGSLE